MSAMGALLAISAPVATAKHIEDMPHEPIKTFLFNDSVRQKGWLGDYCWWISNNEWQCEDRPPGEHYPSPVTIHEEEPTFRAMFVTSARPQEVTASIETGPSGAMEVTIESLRKERYGRRVVWVASFEPNTLHRLLTEGDYRVWVHASWGHSNLTNEAYWTFRMTVR